MGGEQRDMVNNTWDKRETETNRAYSAFLVYRGMGALRSLTKASTIFYGIATDAKRHQFLRWSSAHNWVARCSDWDTNEEQLRMEQKRKDIREMDKRHARDGMKLSKIGVKNIELQATDTLDENGNLIGPKIPVAESTKLFTEGVKAERLARGEVTEISGHKGELKTVIVVKYEGEDETKHDSIEK